MSGLQGLESERLIHLMATQLAVCGVRPTIIRAAIGKRISLAEANRIFRLGTFLSTTERRGRVVRPSRLFELNDGRLLLYCRLMADVIAAVNAGAEVADALAASWRIETSRRGILVHKRIGTARLEDLAVLYLNYAAGEVAFDPCPECHTPVLSLVGHDHACPFCDKRANQGRRYG